MKPNLDMIDEVAKRLAAKPFDPFEIVTTGGDRLRVASRDHAFLTPRRTRVVVMFNDDSVRDVLGQHIQALTHTP